MYIGLSPGAINVNGGNIENAITLAKRHGFGGVEFSPGEVADLIDQRGAAAVKALFDGAGVRAAGTGLPGRWREADINLWKQDLEQYPRWAKAMQAVGCTRCSTWIMPCSSKPFDENYAFHVERIRPAAKILADHGVSIGLEFIGPKTLRDTQPYPFIHTMFAMIRMGQDIGPNVGLLLDCFHWYTAHNTLDDLHKLTPAQVVYVHVNDGQPGRGPDEQIDNQRALPGEHGVIDITGFLKALKTIGYDGPVVCEPFKPELKSLPDDDARLKTVADSLRKVMKQAGV